MRFSLWLGGLSFLAAFVALKQATVPSEPLSTGRAPSLLRKSLETAPTPATVKITPAPTSDIKSWLHQLSIPLESLQADATLVGKWQPSPSCLGGWSDLVALGPASGSEAREKISVAWSLVERENCIPPANHPVRTLQSEFLKKCSSGPTWDCRHALERYRARALLEVTRGIPISRLSDPMLVSRLIDVHFAGGEDPLLERDPSNVEPLLKRLLELDPNNPQAATTLLGWQHYSLDFDHGVAEKMGSFGDDWASKVDTYRAVLQTAQRNDPQSLLTTVGEIELSRLTESSDVWEQKARALSEGRSEKWLEPYYQAWAAQTHGDFAEAQRLAEEVVRRVGDGFAPLSVRDLADQVGQGKPIASFTFRPPMTIGEGSFSDLGDLSHLQIAALSEEENPAIPTLIPTVEYLPEP